MYRYTQTFISATPTGIDTSDTSWRSVPTNLRNQRLWFDILYPLEFGCTIQFDNEAEYITCGLNTKTIHFRLYQDNDPPRGFKSNRKELTYTRVKARNNQRARYVNP